MNIVHEVPSNPPEKNALYFRPIRSAFFSPYTVPLFPGALSFLRQTLICWLFLVFTVELAAESSDPKYGEDDKEEEIPLPEDLPEPAKEPIRRITTFLGTNLPGALEKYNMSLDFIPKVGDFFYREYVRFPLTLRYGLTDTTEILAGWTPFTPNPFYPDADHRWGSGLLRTGARQELGKFLFFFDQWTFGADVVIPSGRPPEDLGDYFGRFRPYLLMSRELTYTRGTRFLFHLNHDRAFSVPHRSEDAAFPRIHRSSFGPGYLYQPNELGYLFKYRYLITEEETETRNGHQYTAKLIWEIPEYRTRNMKLPGQWQVTAGYTLTDEEQRSLNHSFRMGARISLDLREFRDWWRQRRDS